MSMANSRPIRERRPFTSILDLRLETSMSSAMYRLTNIHRGLDEAISREAGRRLPDSLKLLRLKKLRLLVKDRLALLMTRPLAV